MVRTEVHIYSLAQGYAVFSVTDENLSILIILKDITLDNDDIII